METASGQTATAPSAPLSYGRDCRNKPITNLEWARRREHMSIDELSARSGVNTRQIQRIEQGEGKMGNVTLTNALALADALDVDVRELL